jgi:hypothetical protein
LGFASTAGFALGLRFLLHYESTPVGMGLVPVSWPSTSQIERDKALCLK